MEAIFSIGIFQIMINCPQQKALKTQGHCTMGVMKGENTTIIRVWPKRGKLVVLSAFDLHGVPAYKSNFERWGYCIFTTDQKGAEDKHANRVPERFRSLLERPSFRPSKVPHRAHSTRGLYSHSPHFSHSPHISKAKGTTSSSSPVT